MEYIIYALAAIGVHNLWFYQKIMSFPRAFVEKMTTKIPVVGEGIACDLCFGLWIITGMMYAGPYIPVGILYALAFYPIFLFYLSFKNAFNSITKKYEMHMGNLNHDARIARQPLSDKNTQVDNETENRYKGNIKRASPTGSVGERATLNANDEGCTGCQKAKTEREQIEGKS